MSLSRPKEEISQSSEFKKPAIGVIATGTNTDEIARIVIRASAHDHPVLITHPPDVSFQIPEIDELPNIFVISPEVDNHSTGSQTQQEHLVGAAKALSIPNLLYCQDTSQLIDFDKSVEELQTNQYIQDVAFVEPEEKLQTLVAIPAYNEAETIELVVKKAKVHADEVVVIDDGSSDSTAKRAKKADATVIKHEYNRGYGAALSTAFETAEEWDAECLVIIDGDNQHDTNDIAVLSELIYDGDANVAIGSRFVDGASGEIPLYRKFGLSIINLMTNLSMGTYHPQSWIRDTQSGFRAYDRKAIETLSDAEIGNGMDASLDILYQLHDENIVIKEESTNIDYEVENGHSKNPVAHGIQLISTILQTIERKHPILLLGVPGFILTLSGLVLGYLTVANYMTTASFPLGFALSASFFILLGVFSAFTSIMLHSLNAHLEN